MYKYLKNNDLYIKNTHKYNNNDKKNVQHYTHGILYELTVIVVVIYCYIMHF